MKKIFTTLGLMLTLMGSNAIAQKIEIGERNDYVRFESSLLGQDENNYYVMVGYNYNKENKGGSTLYTYDKNLNIVSENHIDENLRTLTTHSFITNNKISMVQADNNFYTMTCEVIDKATKKSSIKKYFFDDLTKNDIADLTTCTSDDDSLFFAMKTIVNQKNGEITKSKMILFDNELNELWSKDYFLPASSIMLTNDGEVIGATHYRDKNENQNLIFTIVTGDNETNFETTVSNLKIGDVEIANYNDGIILAYGLIESDGKKIKNGPYSTTDAYSGFYTLTYNTKTKTLGQVRKYNFSNDDYNIVENKKAKKKNKNTDMAFLLALDELHTADGGAVVSYAKNFQHIYRDQYGLTWKQKVMGGILVWKIEADGSITWHNGFRKSMNAGMFENSHYTPHYLTSNGDVVFVNEHSKKDKLDNTSTVKTVAKRYNREAQQGSGPLPDNITLVRFDKNGNITYEIIHTEKKMLLVGNPNVVKDDKVVMLHVSNGNEPGGLVRINLK